MTDRLALIPPDMLETFGELMAETARADAAGETVRCAATSAQAVRLLRELEIAIIDRRNNLIVQLAATGRRPTEIAPLVGLTRVRVTQILQEVGQYAGRLRP